MGALNRSKPVSQMWSNPWKTWFTKWELLYSSQNRCYFFLQLVFQCRSVGKLYESNPYAKLSLLVLGGGRAAFACRAGLCASQAPFQNQCSYCTYSTYVVQRGRVGGGHMAHLDRIEADLQTGSTQRSYRTHLFPFWDQIISADLFQPWVVWLNGLSPLPSTTQVPASRCGS